MEIDFSSHVEKIRDTMVVRKHGVQELSCIYGVAIREVELYLLSKGIVPYRYAGNVRTLGIDGQVRLLNSTICIAGCGGLGGVVVELCARLGIGRLVIADGDKFDEGNLNRQLLSTENSIGVDKVECARKRIESINSGIEVIVHNKFIDQDNAEHIIGGCDCVIDALDNVVARLIVQDACRDLSIPMVHGAIGDMLVHVTSIMPGDNTLNDIYSNKGEGKTERDPGNPVITPFLCASIEVSEAVKILLGRGEILRNKLLHFDWMYDDFNIFML